jgi:hypothetical protein
MADGVRNPVRVVSVADSAVLGWVLLPLFCREVHSHKRPPPCLCDLHPRDLHRASVSRPSGEWSDDDYDVLADGIVVGRIMKTAAAAPLGTPWLCQHEDRTPTHG